MAETCNFGSVLDEVLRDMFVIGLQEKSALKKLLSESDLTLKKAFEIALSHEIANKNVDAIHGHGQETVRNVSVQECFRFGKTNHSPDNCFYRDAECRLCKRKGHLQRKCPMEKRNRQKERPHGKSELKKQYGKKGKRSSKVKKVSEDSSTTDEKDSVDLDDDTDDQCNQKSHTLMYIRNVTGKNHSEIMVDVKLNNQTKMRMKVDTGAAVSLISKRMKRKLLAAD